MALRPRPIRRDLIALTALCAIAYALGLTTHGLTNWQEAQRALVAREMQATGAWIVPTVRGEPYLAKPPMIYWAQRTIAAATGREVGVFDLRLTVALAGWLGVIATYLVARLVLFAPDDSDDDPEHDNADKAFAHHAAWWSALGLATGILYTRSSRIGELDILLVPFTVVAIGAIAAAWRSHRVRNRQHTPAMLIACAAAAGATLTKGPPGLLVIMLAAYGGITIYEARHAARPLRTIAAAIAAIALASTFIIRGGIGNATDIISIALAVTLAATAAWMCAGLLNLRTFVSWIRALSRTHPVGVPIVAGGALWLWGKAVERSIGSDAVGAAAAREAADNLRVFVPGSALNNIEAASYGVGIGSIAAIIAIVWLIKDRPKLTPGLAVVIAWVLLGVLAFSLLGKGVPRYLTPVWPGIALLGGAWIASALRDLPIRATLHRVLTIAALTLTIGQAGWYAIGRERLYADRVPRAFLAELLRPELKVDPDRLGVLDYWSPALDFYAREPIELYADAGPVASLPGVPDTPVAQLARDLTRTGQNYTLLVRETAHPDNAGDPKLGLAPLDRLTRFGLGVETLPIATEYRIDNRRTRVIAVRLWAVQPN